MPSWNNQQSLLLQLLVRLLCGLRSLRYLQSAARTPLCVSSQGVGDREGEQYLLTNIRGCRIRMLRVTFAQSMPLSPGDCAFEPDWNSLVTVLPQVTDTNMVSKPKITG